MSFNDYFKQDQCRKSYEILTPVLSNSKFLFNIVGCQMSVAIGQLNDVEYVFQIVLEFFNSTVELFVDLAVYH